MSSFWHKWNRLSAGLGTLGLSEAYRAKYGKADPLAQSTEDNGNKIWRKLGIKGIGDDDPRSDAEKQNDAAQAAFRDQMLAAMQARIANPMPAPQLGAPSWMGTTTPPAQGTYLGGTMPPAPPYAGPPGVRAPAPSGFGAMPVAPPASQAAMQAEIERIRRQKLLDAYGATGSLNLPYGGSNGY